MGRAVLCHRGHVMESILRITSLVSSLFVPIIICICPHGKIYLSRWENIFVHIKQMYKLLRSDFFQNQNNFAALRGSSTGKILERRKKYWNMRQRFILVALSCPLRIHSADKISSKDQVLSQTSRPTLVKELKYEEKKGGAVKHSHFTGRSSLLKVASSTTGLTVVWLLLPQVLLWVYCGYHRFYCGFLWLPQVLPQAEGVAQECSGGEHRKEWITSPGEIYQSMDQIPWA